MLDKSDIGGLIQSHLDSKNPVYNALGSSITAEADREKITTRREWFDLAVSITDKVTELRDAGANEQDVQFFTEMRRACMPPRH